MAVDDAGYAASGTFGPPIDISAEEYDRLVHSWERPSKRRADFPRRRKACLIALVYLLRAFRIRETYTEDEVNSLILERSPFAMDHVHLRRYLVDYKMLDRRANGTGYRVGLRWMEAVRLDTQIANSDQDRGVET